MCLIHAKMPIAIRVRQWGGLIVKLNRYLANMNPRLRTRLFFTLFWIVLMRPFANAVDPDRRISQYAHTAWRLRDGLFPGVPTAITQTKDGYVWIGTLNGLVRFDGVRFVRWVPPAR